MKSLKKITLHFSIFPYQKMMNLGYLLLKKK